MRRVSNNWCHLPQIEFGIANISNFTARNLAVVDGRKAIRVNPNVMIVNAAVHAIEIEVRVVGNADNRLGIGRRSNVDD